ncbi:uncharacterized protein METZ01_LOCUS399134, partial [marine metagenome]
VPDHKGRAETGRECGIRLCHPHLSSGDFGGIATHKIEHRLVRRSRLTGGNAPKASQVRKMISRGCP